MESGHEFRVMEVEQSEVFNWYCRSCETTEVNKALKGAPCCSMKEGWMCWII